VTPDDADLVAHSQRGDLDAYGELVRRYQDVARRVGAAIGGVDTAEDAVQEGFVNAFRALGQFDASRPFRPWLLAIVANTARNQRRSATRRERVAQRAAGAERVVTNESAEDTVLTEHVRRRVEQALASLSHEHRDVVACRYLMELSEEETAEALGIPPGTVKSRLSRALDRMQQLMREEAAHD
jgi:RNA polymerase sigma-70 factor (ECF subfamily)